MLKKIDTNIIITILVICLLCLLVLTIYLLIDTTFINNNIDTFVPQIKQGSNVKLIPNENLSTAIPSNYYMYGPSIGSNGNGQVAVQFILPEKQNEALTGNYGFIIYDFTGNFNSSFVKIVRNDGLELYHPSTGTFPGFDSQSNPTFFSSDNYSNSGIPSSPEKAGYLIAPIPNATLKSTTTQAPTTTLAPTTTQIPTTTKYNCIVHMGNILNTTQTNINNCNSDSNCYYLGGNCRDYSSSTDINDKNLDLKCSYTLQNPNSNSSPYILSFGCNNENINDENYYIIQSISYNDADGNPKYLYKYDPLSSDITKNSKDNIPFIYNGSIQNISIVSSNTDQIDNINITDIKGNTKNFKLNNNLINYNNSQKIIAPNYPLLSQIQVLNTSVIENVSNSSK